MAKMEIKRLRNYREKDRERIIKRSYKSKENTEDFLAVQIHSLTDGGIV